MLDTTSERPVHIPANPDRFQFDAEVAAIFPDMAHRAIPNFHLAHRQHAMIVRSLHGLKSARILDVGSSRGAFRSHLLEQGCGIEGYLGIDSSPDMVALASRDWPGAEFEVVDLMSRDFSNLRGGQEWDVICCNYVLQFLPYDQQHDALNLLLGKLAPGGVLFLGHKERVSGKTGELASERYIAFRLANGYTREEIEAKTRALQGSMYPVDLPAMKAFLTRLGYQYQETTRFMSFSTMMVMPNGD